MFYHDRHYATAEQAIAAADKDLRIIRATRDKAKALYADCVGNSAIDNAELRRRFDSQFYWSQESHRQVRKLRELRAAAAERTAHSKAVRGYAQLLEITQAD